MHRRVILIVAAMGVLAACSSTHAHPAAPTSSPVPTSPSVSASSPVPASSSAPAPAPGGPATLTGNLVAVGGPSGATPNPLPGTVTIAGPVTQGVNVTQHVTVGPDGTYTATLPPGTYTVSGTSPQYNDGAATCRTDADTVTLTSGQSATADVLCQEK